MFHIDRNHSPKETHTLSENYTRLSIYSSIQRLFLCKFGMRQWYCILPAFDNFLTQKMQTTGDGFCSGLHNASSSCVKEGRISMTFKGTSGETY